LFIFGGLVFAPDQFTETLTGAGQAADRPRKEDLTGRNRQPANGLLEIDCLGILG
jgi:hypothetical protein